MDPLNVDELATVSLTSSTSDDAAWVGGYFAYGGHDADASTVITFAVPPGKRLGKHVDTREETQFILAGEGDLFATAARRRSAPATCSCSRSASRTTCATPATATCASSRSSPDRTSSSTGTASAGRPATPR